MPDLSAKAIQACHMSLYPKHDSLVEAIEFIESQAPLEAHELFPLLMRYHNTLIAELAKSPPSNVIPLMATRKLPS